MSSLKAVYRIYLNKMHRICFFIIPGLLLDVICVLIKICKLLKKKKLVNKLNSKIFCSIFIGQQRLYYAIEIPDKRREKGSHQPTRNSQYKSLLFSLLYIFLNE